MPPEPLATTSRGTPLLFAALGASFHLEHLVPEDAARLAKAHALIEDAFATELRWTWSSVHGAVTPYEPGDLALAATHATMLENPEHRADPRAQRAASIMAATAVDRFGLACHGAATRNHASPFSYRFYARIPEPGVAERFPACAMLAFTVPLEFPLDRFCALALAVGGLLRLRWGNAGHTYGAWEHDRYGETRRAIHAHARRYPGFDTAQHATLMGKLHTRVRSVSHLTFLGPALRDELTKLGQAPKATRDVTLTEAGEALVARAGERPEAGDTNRRRVPPAYAEVDAMIRPVRLDAAHFFAPWSETTTRAWLGRFEDAGRA